MTRRPRARAPTRTPTIHPLIPAAHTPIPPSPLPDTHTHTGRKTDDPGGRNCNRVPASIVVLVLDCFINTAAVVAVVARFHSHSSSSFALALLPYAVNWVFRNTRLSIYLSVCLFACLYIWSSVHPSIRLSICLPVHLFIYLSIYPSVYPST